MALPGHSSVFFELSWWCFEWSQPVYPLLRLWHRALDEWFIHPLAISWIISWHTPTSPHVIHPCDDDITHPVCLMKHVVHVFKDSSRLNLTNDSYNAEVIQIFNLLIHDHSVPNSGSTITGELCIMAIMISPGWDQTSVNRHFYYIFYLYDISMKPRMR